MKRGKGVGEGTWPEGERGGKNEGKRVGGKGPESTLEKLRRIQVDYRQTSFSGKNKFPIADTELCC